MIRAKFILAFFGALLVAGSSVQAASITYTLTIEPAGAFSVYAQVSAGDNGGLATFGVPLVGDITSINNVAPMIEFAFGPGGSGPVGFVEFRSADASPNGPTTIAGGQKLIPTPTPYVVYGFGQTGGTIGAGLTTFGASEQTTYSAPLLLATGTYDGEVPDFDYDSADLAAALFTSASGSATFSPEVFTNVIVPEPSALALAGLGLAGVLALRRKLG